MNNNNNHPLLLCPVCEEGNRCPFMLSDKRLALLCRECNACWFIKNNDISKLFIFL